MLEIKCFQAIRRVMACFWLKMKKKINFVTFFLFWLFSTHSEQFSACFSRKCVPVEPALKNVHVAQLAVNASTLLCFIFLTLILYSAFTEFFWMEEIR